MAVVLAGLVLMLVGLFGITATALSSGNEASDYGVPSTSSAPSSTEEISSSATSGTSTSATSTTSSDTSTETSSSSETGSAPRAVYALGDNPFNIAGTGAANTGCDLPSFSTSVAAQDAFYQAALPCLMDAWDASLEEANLPVREPSVVTTGNDINSPCGTRGWNQTAMYCPGNHTIYMTARYYSEVEGRSDAGIFLGQFAHEFGHAIQGMTGINGAYGDALYDAGGVNTAGGLELSRRSELQATCFEGMALAALQNGGVSNDYIFPALEDSAARGDEYNKQRDHGSKATNNSWVNQGFKKNRTTECNTWLSNSSDVD